MSNDTVNIPRKELECLREHLNEAMKIFQSLGVDVGADAPAKTPKKVSFKEGVNNYMKLLDRGDKRTFPEHLIQKKATR